MCRRVTISTDDSGSWKRETLLRADDMHDTLTLVPKSEVGQPEGFYVVFECEALGARIGLFDELSDVFEIFSGRRRNVLSCFRDGSDVSKFLWGTYMICGGESAIRPSNLTLCVPQAFKCLLVTRSVAEHRTAVPGAYWRRDFMNKMSVYPDH